MDYKSHYDRLIERARGRVLYGYSERHHEVPRCMGGGNEPGNLVDLTAEEHFVAHLLLVRIHNYLLKLVLAANLMARGRCCANNKDYGWLRRRLSEAQRGRKMPAEAVEKMAASKRGKPISEEMRLKLIAANTGRVQPKEERQRRAIASTGRKHSDESKKKMSEAKRGRVLSAETRARMSIGHKGLKKSLETCRKISQIHLGMTYSAETRAKISATKRAQHAAKVASACAA